MSGIVIAIVGVIGAFASGYYLQRIQRSRTELGWEILTASIIIPRLSKPSLDFRITVRSALLSDADTDNSLVPVDDDIVGFRVRVRNTGNTVIHHQQVNLLLSSKARVLSIEPERQPDLGGELIETHVQAPSYDSASATLPFLNPHQEAIFSLQCLGDLNTNCRVTAGAPGLTTHDIRITRKLTTSAVWIAVSIVLVGITGVLRLLVETGGISDHAKQTTTTLLVGAGILASFITLIAVASAFTDDEPRPGNNRPYKIKLQWPNHRGSGEPPKS